MHSRTLQKGRGNAIVIELLIVYVVDLIVQIAITVEQSTVVRIAKTFRKTYESSENPFQTLTIR